MIFKGTVDKVLDGTKTQTRRPVRKNHGCVSFPNSPETEMVIKSRWHPCLIHRKIWKVGQDYAVQPGRGKKSIGRIRIKSIHKEKLMDISLTDCIAEGIETTPGEAEGAHVPEHKERFAELWNSLYPQPEMKFNYASPYVYVWVLEFELVEQE